MRIIRCAAVFVSFVICITPLSGYAQQTPPKKTKILFITVDALRPDHLSCYGYGRKTSLNIDALARQGAVFTNAIVQASYTLASVASIFTSQYPHQHQVVYPWNPYLRGSFNTLAEILREHGYSTAAITPNFVLDPQFGFRQGFDFCSMEALEEKQTDIAIKWMRERKDNPFFIWVHYMSPHVPYAPPPPYDKLYINDEYFNQDAETLEVVENLSGLGGIPRHAALENITNRKYYIALYDGEISYADYEVGRLLDEIKKIGILDDILIILTADHGEHLGEHGYHFSHGYTLYDSLIRVPLIMKLSKSIPEGKIINSQIESIDIAPTIMDLLDINKYPDMKGLSLVSLILGKEDMDRYAFSDIVLKQSIRTNDWKLIYNEDEGTYELYNLREDPGESYNLNQVEKDKFLFLKEKLGDFIKDVKWPESWKTGQDIPVKPLKPQVSHETYDEELKERLRSLGYIQ